METEGHRFTGAAFPSGLVAFGGADLRAVCPIKKGDPRANGPQGFPMSSFNCGGKRWFLAQFACRRFVVLLPVHPVVNQTPKVDPCPIAVAFDEVGRQTQRLGPRPEPVHA